MKRILQIFIAIIPLIVSFSTSDPTLAIRFLILGLIVSGFLIYYLLKNKAIYKEVITHPAIIVLGIVVIGYLFSMLIS